tara:strand:- start:230 stop:1186 length:957 start_codon:yes stop_codon:yes gene_type:complete
MAARATRSASRKARATEAVATGPLGALSHDELGVIFDGLADPLQPVVAVALSSTCLGLRTPLGALLEVLKERHERAVALCRKMEGALCNAQKLSCAVLQVADWLNWTSKGVTADDMATLGMILRTRGLPRLHALHLGINIFGESGMQALCEGLGPGAAPSLRMLSLGVNHFGPVGAEALATALRGGAMPNLATLGISDNPIGNQGVAALASPLRKRPALKELVLSRCEIGDEGVASLVANLGKDDFKVLTRLFLNGNEITDASCDTLARALDAGAFPALLMLNVNNNRNNNNNNIILNVNDAARQTVQDALTRAIARR